MNNGISYIAQEHSETAIKISSRRGTDHFDSGMDDECNSGIIDTGGDSSGEEDIIVARHTNKCHRILDDESDDSRDVPEKSMSHHDKPDVMTAEDVLAAVLNDSSSDSEAEQTVLSSLKNKKVKRPVMDSSDDDDDENQTLSNVAKSATAEDVLAAVLNDSSSDSEAEQTVLSSLKKKKVKRPVMDSSNDDDDENQTLPNVAKSAESQANVDDGESREGITDTEFGTKDKGDKEESPTINLPSDLFDAEDSDDPGVRSSSDSDRSGSESEKEDEGFDESSIDPKLLAKLKKGAGKKERRVSSARQRKEDVTQLHSETQRIVRESRANVPYHQPAPKSINVFLARASRKQQEYKVLRGMKATTKARVLQDVLEKTRIKSVPKTQEERDKYSDSDSDWNPEDNKEMSLKDRLDMKLKNQCSAAQQNGDQIVIDINTNSQTEGGEECETVESRVGTGSTECVSRSLKSCNSDDTDNDLPDLDSCINIKSNSVALNNSMQLGENSLSQDKSENSTLADTVCSSDARTIEDSGNAGTDMVTRNSADGVVDKATTEEDSGINTQETETEKDSCVITSVLEDNGESMEMENTVKTPVKGIEDVDSSDCKTLTTAKLAALAGLELSDIRPCLSGRVEDVITLEEGETTPQHPGVAKLMDRLCKHSAKREKKHAKDMDISIIEKEQVGVDKEELKLTTFTYHVEEEDDDPLANLDKPGAKLGALKRQLQDAMRARREAARQRRQQLHDLDNEEGGFMGGVAGEEEDEMSEHSDTDVEDDDFEEQFGDDEMEGEEEEDMGEEDGERKKNPFADEEADEEGDGDDDNDEQESDDNDDDSGDDEMNLKLDVSDGESDEEKITPGKKKSRVAPISEDDKTSDVTDFKEPEPEKVTEKPFSMFGCRSRDSSISETQLQSGQRSFNLALPIEDSQDLYGHTNTLPELATQPPPDTQPSQSFNFFLEDSQSNMLDADGYLKVKSTGKKVPKVTAIDDLAGTQGNMDDLLGLCSGRFAETQSAGKDKFSRKSLFDGGAGSTQGNMDQLMGLCSGVFTSSNDEPSQKKGVKRKVSRDDEDSCSADSLVVLSDNEDNGSEKDKFSDEEADGDNSGDESDAEKPRKFTGFTAQNKHGKILNEFVEDEAELSGSEFASDEDLDLPEEEDIMEMEEGDTEAAKLDQEQLRDEVGRVHLKQLIDEDKRELVRFQEMYLPDGDLHSDGAGRTRKFRWNNMDDESQQDMFGQDSDGEHAEEEHDTDYQWRKERYEREQFIKEQQDKENVEDEGSQFLKFGKVFLKKQVSTEVTEKEDATKTTDTEDPSANPGSFYKLSSQKRGSFLARSKKDLAKIAERTKPVSNPSAGAKTSGKFTFSVISPDKDTEAPQKPQLRKALSANQTTSDKAIKKPPAKKPKLDKSASFTQRSIFNHL